MYRHMFWSQPNPWANSMGWPCSFPATRTLFLAQALIPRQRTGGRGPSRLAVQDEPERAVLAVGHVGHVEQQLPVVDPVGRVAGLAREVQLGGEDAPAWGLDLDVDV